MKFRLGKGSKVVYLLFCIPFILACVSWLYFPDLAYWFITCIFKYDVYQKAGWLWYLVVRFFYTWYTFLAIGVAGVWAVAATLAKKQWKKRSKQHYPMVSFVVSAYNEEKNVSRCINSLFRCAEKYDGLCEIIVVDDGSSDFTYEIAWAVISLTVEGTRRFAQKLLGIPRI